MIHYWSAFAELIVTPFRQTEGIWGIVPLYFGLLLNELTSTKASFRTAIQTGFSFLWAGAHWLYPYFRSRAAGRSQSPKTKPLGLADRCARLIRPRVTSATDGPPPVSIPRLVWE